MKDYLKPLASFKYDVTSQNGEDGIIEEILSRLGVFKKKDNWCVEFGAWDGKCLSNTYNLIKNRSFNAVLIEGEKLRMKDLDKNHPEKNVHKINTWVTFEGKNSLDELLSKKNVPINFEFLSIDIDGCDYHILDSIKLYKPEIICVEYNPMIPNDVTFIQEKNFSVKQGSSPKALVNLSIKKGYDLVACTYSNLFFVKKEKLSSVIGNINLTLENLRDDTSLKNYIFPGFDGTLLSNNNEIFLRWHKFSINIKEIQYLPKFLRKYRGDYSPWEKKALLFYRATRNPIKAFKSILKRLSFSKKKEKEKENKKV